MIMDTFLPLHGQKAIDILENAGFEAYAVGGSVRDFLLGKPFSDIDIATSALPKEILKEFADFRTIETGIKHGTITVIIDAKPVEITTFRVDGKYKDNRHPENVSFTKNICEDLKRRDFTVNAIAYNPKLGFIDPFGGKKDLKNKIIRTVGNPKERFSEDALRILRALRFSSCLSFDIENETAQAIHDCKDFLLEISSERINKEFTSLICGENAGKILYDFKDVISVFIPEIIPMIGFNQKNPHHIYDVYVHSLKVVENVPDEKILRLCAFFHDIGKPPVFTLDDEGIGHFYGHQKESAKISIGILNRLKYDKKTIKDVIEIIKYHDITLENENNVKKWLGYYGDENFKRLLYIKKGDILAQNPEYLYNLNNLSYIYNIYKKVKKEKLCIKMSDLAVNGKDIMALGIPKGKKIGDILELILQKVVENSLPNQKNDILDFIKNNILLK